MKKLEKLKINFDKVISSDKLVNLRGGYGGAQLFLCKCGFTGGYTTDCFSVWADSIQDALTDAGNQCDGDGGTCNGEEHGCPD